MVRRVRAFRARGMSFVQMERQTGVPLNRIFDFATKDKAFVHTKTWAPLSRLVFEQPDPHVRIDPTGTRRRIAALWAAGYSIPWLVERLGFPRRYIQMVIAGQGAVSAVEYRTFEAVSALYDECAYVGPAVKGVSDRSAKYARTFAAKKNIPTPGCWDADTIDDPDAEPEWTGECGSERGYQIHYREQIPYCGRCRRAHRDYKDGLSGANLVKQARDADIAEMLDDGVDVAQIAHELGVSERTVVRRKKERAA